MKGFWGINQTTPVPSLQEAEKRNSLGGLARNFFKRASKAIDNSWRMAVSEDLRFPTVQGSKPLGSKWIERYLIEVHKTTMQDRETARALLQVIAMTHSPQILFHPKILLRVARNYFAGQHSLKYPRLASERVL